MSWKLTPEVVETALKSFKNWRKAQAFFNWASNQDGFSHSCHTYNAMAEVLSDARQNAPLRELAQDISNSRCFWTSEALGYFIRCLGSQGLIKEANSLFDQMKVSGLCVLNCYSYYCLLQVISKGAHIDLLEHRLNEMRNLGCPIDNCVLILVLLCYCNAGMLDKALMVFGEMVTNGYMPDISVYEMLISSLCKNKDIGKAIMLCMQMKESRISPNVRIMTEVLLCIHEEIDQIQYLLDSFVHLKFGKRMQLYNAVLAGFVKGGYVDNAYRLLKATVESNISGSCQRDKIPLLRPDITCFQTVIDGLCVANKLDVSLDLFNSMDRSGCKRSVLLFNNMIYFLSNADRLSECFGLMNQMKEEGLVPTHFTFNCILGCLCRREDAAGALELLREMRSAGHEPWIKHYTLLVTKLCRCRKAGEAHAFLHDMTEIGFLPEMVAYSATIDGYINNDELDHGLELFKEISGGGYHPDLVAYNTIIKGLCKAKRITEAENMLDEILGKGFTPSVVTYNLLIDGWCKVGDVDRAFVWFSKIRKVEQEPSVITYTTLVSGLCNVGKPDCALKLWTEMEENGCTATRIAYMALIYGLCKCLKPDVALAYLRKMEEKGMFPDQYVYNALVDVFASNGEMSMCHEVLRNMPKHAATS